MSAAIDMMNTAHADLRGRMILWRFVWKEFRMLRGLWLAVAVLGLLVQCAERMLLPYSSDFPAILFVTALAAAVLYAAGAAATAFSVEHEEETYEFLARLPAAWWPVFVGKLLVGAISAVLLAVSLSIAGWAAWGFSRLGGPDAPTACGVLGIAIFEALAWGTFFSLVVKRPLVAAILTLAVGAVAVNLAVNASSQYAVASTNPRAYVDAVPLRLAIVVAVLACSALVAHRWLAAGARPALRARLNIHNPSVALLNRVLSRLGRFGIIADRGVRRRMLARLLWQTWRESWKLLFLPLAVALALFVGIAALVGLVGFTYRNDELVEFLLASTPLFVPALYGAMAFYADQRRGNYQFLAEHAARPRYVWLARHVIWLGSLVAVWLLLMGICVAFMGALIRHSLWRFVNDYIHWGAFQYPGAPDIVYDLADGSNYVFRLASLASFGGLVAYSIGQLCSMALRSEILAAFVALLLSFVVCAWVAALFAWQLGGWMFLLPLFAGFMLATWLRAPDWIAGPNSLQAWSKPALAILAPLGLIATLLPSARLAQIPTDLVDRNMPYQVGHADNAHAIAAKLHAFQQSDTPYARETADMYIRAAERPLPEKNFLAPWEKPEYLEETAVLGGIDEAKIPADQQEAFQAAKKKQLELIEKANAATIGLAIKASERLACHFDFDSRMIGIRPIDQNRQFDLVQSYPLYGKLNSLLTSVALAPAAPNKPIDGLLAALRMSAHLRSGQPSIIFIYQLARERQILQWIGQWAGQKARTKDELRHALQKLTAHDASSPKPADALLADHQLVRDVLVGKDVPLILAQQPIPLRDYLAFLANQLPWERERALLALDRITLRNIQEVNEVTSHVGNQQPRELGASDVRRWLRPRGGLPELWEIEEPAAATSYLASLEYKARVSISQLNRAYCDNEVCRAPRCCGSLWRCIASIISNIQRACSTLCPNI